MVTRKNGANKLNKFSKKNKWRNVPSNQSLWLKERTKLIFQRVLWQITTLMKAEWLLKPSTNSFMLWVRNKRTSKIRPSKTTSSKGTKRSVLSLQSSRPRTYPRETWMRLSNRQWSKIRLSRSRLRDWTRLEKRRKELKIWLRGEFIPTSLSTMLMSRLWQLFQRNLRLNCRTESRQDSS